MAVRRRFLPLTLLAFAVLAAVLYFGAGWWLPAFGRLLIHDDGPAPADIAVILAGDYTGARALRAAELLRAGMVPRVMVSGPPGMYGVNEADAAVRFLAARGYPENAFLPVYHTATSTREEAHILLAELARLHVRRFLLVTSNYHTGRARRLFLSVERERGGGPEFRTVAAADPLYDPARWWRYREGCKTAFFEWSKTFATFAGL